MASVTTRKSIVKTIPAPIGGWNVKDPISSMPPEDAIVLDNLVPGPLGVELRPGSASHVTGIGAPDPVESLMAYSGPSGINKLFAAAGTKIYEVTGNGTSPSAALTSLVNARFSHTMFATSGGNFLVAANGGTGVRNYDGTNWTTPSITNVTSADLIFVLAHVSRLWFIEKNTLKVWYLPVSSIAGAAVAIDLGPLCKLGGTLVSLQSWTRDGGSGPDDLLVALTDKGEALIYQGTDPSSTTTWGLVGIFRIPEPIGKNCMLKTGGDVGVLTSQGVLPLSVILPLTLSGTARAAATDKINGAIKSAYAANSATFGWQIIEYPKGALLIVNVPTGSGTTSDQFVMNAYTGAWCRFTGLNALCWAIMGDTIYFGTTDGRVVQFDTGQYVDDDNAIPIIAFPAFNTFGTPSNKHFKMARPLFTAAQGTVPPLTLKVDYETSAENLPSYVIPDPGTDWDVGDWDDTSWGPISVAVSDWQSISGIGQVGSLYMSFSSKTSLRLNQIDVMYQVGGSL